MGYNLFLDDERMPYKAIFRDCSGLIVSGLPEEWIVVRNYEQFVRCLDARGMPDIVSFDHDLADEHYVEGIEGAPPLYDTYKEKTGYHCACHLVTYCFDLDADLPTYYCHSFNPVGRDNICAVLNSYQRMRDAAKEAAEKEKENLKKDEP